MNVYPFEYSEKIQLIVIIASIDDYDIRVALDTGASKTLIDLTVSNLFFGDMVDLDCLFGQICQRHDIFEKNILKKN